MLTQQEIGRQMIHILVGIITVLLIHFQLLSPLAIFLIIIVGILASIVSKRINLPFFTFFLTHFERDNEKNRFPGKGMIFFFIGVLLVVKLFPHDIAMASIMVLALGDSISHLFGAQFGKIQNIFNKKSRKLFEGTLAGTVTGFLGALLFVPIPEAFLGSLIAMIAEVVKIDFNDKTLDDNLIVPLIAGTVMFLVRKFVV